MLHQFQALSRAIKAREIISGVAFMTSLFNVAEVASRTNLEHNPRKGRRIK